MSLMKDILRVTGDKRIRSRILGTPVDALAAGKEAALPEWEVWWWRRGDGWRWIRSEDGAREREDTHREHVELQLARQLLLDLKPRDPCGVDADIDEHLAFAVADPVSSTVSLAWVYEDPPLLGPGLPKRLPEEVYRWTVSAADGLAALPAVDLHVFVPDDDRERVERARKEYLDWREAVLRQLGRSIPNISFYWHAIPRNGAGEKRDAQLQARVFASHMPLEAIAWPPGAMFEWSDSPSISDATETVAALGEWLRPRREGDAAVPQEALSSLGKWTGFALEPPRDPSPARFPAVVRAAQLLEATLHLEPSPLWPCPLHLTFGTVLLLGGDNGTGKTTLVEALHRLEHGYSRARLRAGAARQLGSSMLIAAESARLRVRPDRSGGEAVPPRLVALFGSDTDIADRGIGDILGLTLELLVRDSRRLEPVFRLAELQASLLRRAEKARIPTRQGNSGWKGWLDAFWAEGLSRADFAPPLGSGQLILDGLQASKPWLELTPNGQRDIESRLLREAELPRECLIDGIAIRIDEVKGNRMREELAATLETAVVELEDPGLVARYIVAMVEPSSRGWLPDLEGWIKKLSEPMELEAREAQVTEFLRVWFGQSRLEEPDAALNTGRLVAAGHARRLARVLTVKPWQPLIVDDASLGQDAAEAARSICRMAMLGRVASALWWNVREPHVEVDSTPALRVLRSGTDREELRSEAPSPAYPFPAQLAMLSYQLAALEVAANHLGTVLTQRLRRALSDLVPDCWQHEVRGAALAAIKAYDEVRKHGRIEIPEHCRERAPGEKSTAPSRPAAVVRLFWRMPELPPLLDDSWRAWWTRADAALDLLRLARLRIALAHASAGRKPASHPPEYPYLLLEWLVASDLLPAALKDGTGDFEIGTLSFQYLAAAGGRPLPVGPPRALRIPAYLQRPPQGSTERARAAVDRHKTEPPAAAAPGEEAASGPVAPAEPARAPAAEAPPAVTPIPAIQVTKLEEPRPAAVPPASIIPSQPPPSGPRSTSRRQWESGEDARFRIELTGTDAPYLWTLRVSGDGPEPRGLAVEAGFDPAGASEHAQVVVSRDGSTGIPLRALPFRLIEARVRALRESRKSELRVGLGTRTVSILGPDLHFQFTSQAGSGGSSLGDLPWREEILDPLLRLESILRALDWNVDLYIDSQVPLTIAVLAGLAFPHGCGRKLRCRQGDETWDLERPPGEVQAPALQARREYRSEAPEGDAAGGAELDVLLSIANRTRVGRDRYRAGAAPSVDVLELERPGGPRLDSIPSAPTAVASADAAARAIARARLPRRHRGGVRLFLSTPAAMAMALGRSLAGIGRIHVMEYERTTGSYYPAVDLTA